MKNILFINACVRENSRTKILADYLLSKLSGNINELRLNDIGIQPLDNKALELRNELSQKGDFDNKIFDLAKEFVSADIIVIAAPLWDLSFPALLKIYIELINVVGLAFVYTDTGKPKGLCKAEKLYYVTTSGGPITNDEFGYGYIKTLAKDFYNIPDTVLIKAENLDIVGANVNQILESAKQKIDELFTYS